MEDIHLSKILNQLKKKILKINLKTKDHNTIIKELTSDKDAIFYFTNGIAERPYVLAQDLAKEAKKFIKEEQIKISELKDAIKEVKQMYKDRVIFIIGSFYVYKEVMQIIGE